MTRDEAVAYVKMQALTDLDPALSDVEVDYIVDECAVADVDGNAPSSPDWRPNYWAVKAVSKAWDLKLDKAAQWVNVSTDGTVLSAGDGYNHLEKAAARWRRRCIVGL